MFYLQIGMVDSCPEGTNQTLSQTGPFVFSVTTIGDCEDKDEGETGGVQLVAI